MTSLTFFSFSFLPLYSSAFMFHWCIMEVKRLLIINIDSRHEQEMSDNTSKIELYFFYRFCFESKDIVGFTRLRWLSSKLLFIPVFRWKILCKNSEMRYTLNYFFQLFSWDATVSIIECARFAIWMSCWHFELVVWVYSISFQ